MSFAVLVKPSTIPNAGNGLFAARDFAPGDTVCEYTGKVLTLVQALKAADSTYMMGGFGLNVHLDARECPESMGRYINDPRNPHRYNVEFKKIKEARKALVVASRTIRKGEEIFASYGSSYWNVHEGTVME